MRVTSAIGLMTLLCLCAAAQPSVTLRVERNTVAMGSPFMITIEASGDRVVNPTLPDVDGLRIDKVPSQTSSRIQIVMNGPTSSQLQVRSLGYRAEATRLGTVEIPAIPVRVDGSLLYTQAVTLTVVAAPQPIAPTPPMPAPGAPPTPSNTPAGSQRTELSWDKLAFLRSFVDKQEVFQGEPILLRLQLWRIDVPNVIVGARRGADMMYPATEGFYAATFEPKVTRNESDGFPYEVSEYQQMLYPTTTGDLVIGPWQWQGGARALTEFGPDQRNLDLTTPEIRVKVNPLPPSPPEFSGAVGTFTFDAQINRQDVVQGVPIKLKLVIAGRGNPNAIGEPKLPAITGAYVSDPDKETQDLGEEGSVAKVSTYSITPLEEGQMTIPEISFCYFDVASASYKTLTQGPFTITVLASAESDRHVLSGDAVTVQDRAVDVLAEDIQPIVQADAPLKPRRSSIPMNLLLGAAPVAAYLGLAAWARRKHRFEHDPAFAREYHAKSKSQKRLQAAAQAADPTEELYHAVTSYLADKLNVSEGGMTSADAQRLLQHRGVDPAIEDQFVKILRACERSRYGTGRLSSEEALALTHAAMTAVDSLDEAIKKRPARRKES